MLLQLLWPIAIASEVLLLETEYEMKYLFVGDAGEEVNLLVSMKQCSVSLQRDSDKKMVAVR